MRDFPKLNLWQLVGGVIKTIGAKAVELTGAITGTSATFTVSVSAPTITMSDGTDSHTIKAVQEPGLGGRLTIGLDETARTMVVCDAGDVDTDFGFGAPLDPRLCILNSASTYFLSMSAGSLVSNYTSGFIINNYSGPVILRTANDRASGNAVEISSPADNELTDTDGEQSWLYIEPKINQSATAAYNAVKIAVTETALGDGSTGQGNNLIWAGVGGTQKFEVDNAGNVTTAGSVSAGIPRVTKAATGSLSAADMRGCLVTNKGQTDDAVISLPAVFEGAHCMVCLETTVAKYWRLDPDASEVIIFNGTTLTGGYYVGIASAVDGAMLSVVARYAETTLIWDIKTITETWVAQA